MTPNSHSLPRLPDEMLYKIAQKEHYQLAPYAKLQGTDPYWQKKWDPNYMDRAFMLKNAFYNPGFVEKVRVVKPYVKKEPLRRPDGSEYPFGYDPKVQYTGSLFQE